MEKIIIIGCPGAGKSTLAKALIEKRFEDFSHPYKNHRVSPVIFGIQDF